mmetsp:Transcript_9761/g.21439  ORF Transcript_9761/g.21439 Transcript_9761/m.21439 type:complete len:214 (+) Transcript_9761:852-1493(+)
MDDRSHSPPAQLSSPATDMHVIQHSISPLPQASGASESRRPSPQLREGERELLGIGFSITYSRAALQYSPKVVCCCCCCCDCTEAVSGSSSITPYHARQSKPLFKDSACGMGRHWSTSPSRVEAAPAKITTESFSGIESLLGRLSPGISTVTRLSSVRPAAAVGGTKASRSPASVCMSRALSEVFSVAPLLPPKTIAVGRSEKLSVRTGGRSS